MQRNSSITFRVGVIHHFLQHNFFYRDDLNLSVNRTGLNYNVIFMEIRLYPRNMFTLDESEKIFKNFVPFVLYF